MPGWSEHNLKAVLVLILPYFTFALLYVSPASLTTTLGKVTGIRKVAGSNRKVDVFYGIPFAKPPVGELRFKHPVPAEPWKDALDGTQKPNSCWQIIDTSFNRFPGVEMWNPNTDMSEDCLYLNVWRPVCSENCTQTSPKSIMVWIYGGAFTSGTTTLDVYDATQLSALNDVIVVSVAYRLGVLGFLYLGDSDVPGNAGFMDQALALKWIKDNAFNLGGSPDSITIFGESAGAYSVGFHLLSPISRNYFTYAIMQSAAPTTVKTNDEARSFGLLLAKELSCLDSNMSASIDCLLSIPPKILSDAQANMKFLSFALVVDGHFMPDDPIRMIKRGDIKNTSVLLGVNKNEGIYFAIYRFPEDFPLEGNGEISESQLDRMIKSYFDGDSDKSEMVKLAYRNILGHLSNTELIDAIVGDIMFKCPVASFADLLYQNSGDVFLYSFEHPVSNNPWPDWTGVVHGYEIELVFGLPLAPGSSQYTEEDKDVSLQMMKLWTNFAKTGNPNYSPNNEWPKYRSDSKKYAIIDAKGLTIGQELRQSECRSLARPVNPRMKDTPTTSKGLSSVDPPKPQDSSVSVVLTLIANITIQNTAQQPVNIQENINRHMYGYY